MRSFGNQSIRIVGNALYIAEDVTADFYKFSAGQWGRHRFDVKTLRSLGDDEISEHAFAVLNKQGRQLAPHESKSKGRDFYFICLQDHRILEALSRDSSLLLLPLLVYVLTHELVHIVRFCNFLQRFKLEDTERDKEERIVHETTFEILRDVPLPRLDYILGAYREHRCCGMFHCAI